MEYPLVGKVKRPLPWLLGLIAGGVILVGGATYVITQTPSSSKVEQLTVPVERQNLTVEIEANGRIEPVRKVNLSPETSGRVVQLLVEAGDRVKEGQTLAIMKPDAIQAQGLQAQAQLKEAIASLNEAQTNLTGEIGQAQARLAQAQASLQQARQRIPKEVDQAQAAVAAAEARYRLAGERVRRYRFLVDEGASAQDQLDEALNEYRSAEASLFEARQRLKQLETTANPELEGLRASVAEAQLALEQRQRRASDEIAQLQAGVESAQAQLAGVQVDFQDTVITAPFDGVITEKNAEEGEIVAPTLGAGSTSILTLASPELKIVAQVPEVDVGQLQRGQKVRIFTDAYPNEMFMGQIQTIAPEAVEENNVTTFEVTVKLLTGQDQLRSNMNVDVTFLGKEISDALVVPTVAIVTEEGETGVMVPDENNLPEFQPVTIGLTIDDKTQILDGLTSGERVFTDLPEENNRLFFGNRE